MIWHYTVAKTKKGKILKQQTRNLIMPKLRIPDSAVLKRKQRNARNHHLEKVKRKRAEFISVLREIKGQKPLDAHPHRPWMERHTMKALSKTVRNGDRKLTNHHSEP
ncbi:MAG: hypothetical protein WC308_00260 [archaeon]|jgi:hypothetical protein